MRVHDHGAYRVFGLEPQSFETYGEALESGLRGDGAKAVELLAALAEQAPGCPLLRYHHMSALFAEGRDGEGIAAFRAIQAADELGRHFGGCDLLLQGPEGPLPDQEPARYRVVGEGSQHGTFARDFMSLERLYPRAGSVPKGIDYMVMAKAGTATRVYEKELGETGGIVFEGLIRKHAGADECARIEIETPGARETLTLNGGLLVLGSNSAVVRLPLHGRFRSFRFVLHRGESRLWVDGYGFARSLALPPATTGRVRFGLFAAPEQLDTSFFWSSLRVLWAPRHHATIEDLAPAPRMEEGLSNLAVLFTVKGRPEEALDCFLPALEGRAGEDIIHNFEEAARTFAERWQPDEPRLVRCLEAVRLASGEERAAEVRTTIQQRRRELAVSCRAVSIYFARAPHRILRPLEIAKRIMNPRRYFEENYWWAVRDVSFDLRYGEVLGVIGNNGAGKSTLLRAVAGMLDHEGRIVVNGRTRLLVMGLGVQEELTGRQNILLTGLYLGLRRRVVLQKLDSILDFAELREFENVPYKYYSDGMRARLLFAIATSVEPDIILLDELLGAGDVTFRAKAMRRMEQLLDHCKAVIVVTHNLSFVRDRATKALYLDRGRVVYYGDPNKAVDTYLEAAYRLRGDSPAQAGYLLHEV